MSSSTEGHRYGAWMLAFGVCSGVFPDALTFRRIVLKRDDSMHERIICMLPSGIRLTLPIQLFRLHRSMWKGAAAPLRDIEIVKSPSGAPSVVLHGGSVDSCASLASSIMIKSRFVALFVFVILKLSRWSIASSPQLPRVRKGGRTNAWSKEHQGFNLLQQRPRRGPGCGDT
jgi:hypothetical protein